MGKIAHGIPQLSSMNLECKLGLTYFHHFLPLLQKNVSPKKEFFSDTANKFNKTF